MEHLEAVNQIGPFVVGWHPVMRWFECHNTLADNGCTFVLAAEHRGYVELRAREMNPE